MRVLPHRRRQERRGLDAVLPHIGRGPSRWQRLMQSARREYVSIITLKREEAYVSQDSRFSNRGELAYSSLMRAKKLPRAAECLVHSLTPSGVLAENHPKNRGFVGILRGQKCLRGRFLRRSPVGEWS